MDMSVYERLNRDGVQPLGHFPAGRGVFVLALIGGQPHLATVDTVPLKVEVLSAAQFITVAARLLEEAEEHLEAVMICGPDLFPAGLNSKAHDLRVFQQFEPS
jgi:hypothetical protein